MYILQIFWVPAYPILSHILIMQISLFLYRKISENEDSTVNLMFVFASLVLKAPNSKDKYKPGSCLCHREVRRVEKRRSKTGKTHSQPGWRRLLARLERTTSQA